MWARTEVDTYIWVIALLRCDQVAKAIEKCARFRLTCPHIANRASRLANCCGSFCNN